MDVTKDTLPAAFVRQMTDMLGPETEAFLASLQSTPPVSIRRNPAKPAANPTDLETVPWCGQGFYLPERRKFTLDPLFHAGAYYVQEASSMLVGEAVRQLFPTRAPLRALDLCAAPGGKSTLLATILPPGSLLLCNEVIRNRHQILRENLLKWGDPGTHSAQHDADHFLGLTGFFDFVLVDAPCSGEGLFRKDPAAIREWSPEAVRRCAARQKRILARAVDLLRPGGILCYSTCTYNDMENSANARWLTETFELETEPLEMSPAWDVATRETGYQCFPHRVRGEGLYLSCFRKTGDAPTTRRSGKAKTDRSFLPVPVKQRSLITPWLRNSNDFDFFQDERGRIFAFPGRQTTDLLFIRRQLRRTNLGVWVGTLKKKDFVPSPDLALSTVLSTDLPRIELDRQQSLRYLKREPITLEKSVQGWALACFQNQPLGWVKGLKNRINNYYPKEWRIRMRIDQ